MNKSKRKRTSGHTYDKWVSASKEDMNDTCNLRHEIGRAGRACCNCIWNEICSRREDR